MAKKTYTSENDVNVSKCKKRDKLTIFLVILIILLLSGACYMLYRAATEQKQFDDNRQVYDAIRQKAVKKSKKKKKSVDPLYREIDFDYLQGINPDVIAWIYVPGTLIDYPVMKEQTVNQYFYLNHNIYRNYNVLGSIFTPAVPGNIEDAHMLLFGHNIYSGAMFGTLDRFATKSFYNEHSNVYMYYPDRTECWEVWSAFQTNDSDMLYTVPYVYNTDDYAKLIQHIGDRAYYDTNHTVTNHEKTLTMSTCRGGFGTTQRFVVTCVIGETYSKR